MATIALCWELGADLGHISRLLSIALELKDRGHRPVMLLRDVSRADSLLSRHGLEYLQAPVWAVSTTGLPPAINFTETLYRFGFLQPQGLLSICRAWRHTWNMLKPDVLVFDHAPTALLAARGFGPACVQVGSSFANPPLSKPLPAYRWWQKPSTADLTRMAETETRATRHANIVLDALGAPLITSMADLFQSCPRFITDRPELDVYGSRHDEIYTEGINFLETGAKPQWPDGDNPCVFAYLKPAFAHLEPLLAAMQRSPARYLIYLPGFSERQRLKFSSHNIAFSDTPLLMADVLSSCSAVICHAGAGVCNATLNAGKPLLLLPMQMEQTMTAHRIEALGAGLIMQTEANPANLPKLLKRLTSDEGLRTAAENLANPDSRQTASVSISRVVDACLSTLSNTDPTPQDFLAPHRH